MSMTGRNPSHRIADGYIYDRAADLFKNKEVRLWGTVIYPGAIREQEIVFQAGIALQKRRLGKRKSACREVRTMRVTLSPVLRAHCSITTIIEQIKSGIRKFLDTKNTFDTPGGDMVRSAFRYAEILLIAGEGSLNYPEVSRSEILVMSMIFATVLKW